MDAWRPTYSSVLGVHGSGPGKDAHGRRKKLKGCSSRNSSFVQECVDDSLEEGIWETLPEEIFHLILERLPFAAQCRLRCLGRKWKGLQTSSSPPPCTILSKAGGDKNARFYCDSERKWFSLPSDSHAPLGRSWELVDADGGLVCYQCNIDNWFWLWVCNPLEPSLSRLIKPNYERRDPRLCVPEAPKIKLLVDRASRSYKIVAKLDQLPTTAVYESATSCWKAYETCPGIVSLKFFVWGSKVHAYSTEKDLKKVSTCLAAFNMKSRNWVGFDMQPQIPTEVHFPTNRFFLSNNDQVMLVQYSLRKRPPWPYFSVWKVLHKGKKFPFASFRKWENWEKVDIGSEGATIDLRGHRLARASFGAEHLCFTFRGDDVTPDGSRGYKCVRYSLQAKSWSEVPWPRDCGESFELHNWEPSLDIDLR